MTSVVTAWGLQFGLIALIITPIVVVSCYRFVATSSSFTSFGELHQERPTLVYATIFLYAAAGVLNTGGAWVIHADDPVYFPVSAGILLLIIVGVAVGLGVGTRNVDESAVEDIEDAHVAVTLFRGTGWVVAGTATLPFVTPLVV